jgi:hypothetical protein
MAASIQPRPRFSAEDVFVLFAEKKMFFFLRGGKKSKKNGKGKKTKRYLSHIKRGCSCNANESRLFVELK